MSRKARNLPEGRYWTKAQLASHFSRSIDWLNKNYNRLVQQGMPEWDKLFEGFDSAAIINWENERSNINANAAMFEAKAWESQLANGEL